jgi:V/A-type H+/Na+-transporting ATPase subunit A
VSGAPPRARVRRVSGSLVEAAPLREASLYELVAVGERSLLGEVVRTDRDVATIQVYEDTQGLRVGEPVESTGQPMAARLGPGLLGSVLDGVGRPLRAVAASGDIFVRPGTRADTLDGGRAWSFVARRRRGEAVRGGDVLGVVEERKGFEHPHPRATGRGGRARRHRVSLGHGRRGGGHARGRHAAHARAQMARTTAPAPTVRGYPASGRS